MAEDVKKGARITGQARDKLASEASSDGTDTDGVPDESAPVPTGVAPEQPAPERTDLVVPKG